jgi:hypothetical protein
VKITSLEEMESIVDSNPFLKWDGWNVVFLEEDPMANMKKNAMFTDSKWHKAIVYENTNGSWNIPDNIIRKGNV